MSTSLTSSPRPVVPAIGLLGPVSATREDAIVPLGSRLQRGVLAMLALEAGTVVSVDRLSDGLWGGEPPASASGTLRAYVSRLRTGLGGRLLPRVEGGYRLAIPPDAVDALVVGGQVSRARSLAATDLQAAGLLAAHGLSAWRGVPLADVATLPFAGPVAQRLNSHQRTLEAIRGRALLAAADHESVVDLMAAATTRWPADEVLTALHMVALYRAGHQAEALQQYARLRTHLADALGIDPGPQTRSLHQSVLVQDTALLVGDPFAAKPADSPLLIRQHQSGNLPTPLTSFVGRAAELATLNRLAATGRLVTLTGPGGVGKTRLAVEAVRRMTGRTDDGPWLVELAGVTDGPLVASAIAQAVGVVSAGSDSTTSLTTALADRQTVLLLDNCEHVLDEAAHVATTVLQRCPNVAIITTSRQALGVPGEQVLAILPLQACPAGPDLPPGDAETLFAERAALADASFVLDDATRPLVATVCRAVDGIPLAIELAAARLSALSLRQVVDLLSDRLVLLNDDRAATEPRHRTMAAAIGGSYDPLTRPERQMLHAAALFAGGFDLEGLAAVASTSVPDAAVMLTHLVDRSMVAIVDGRAGRRFRVLETIRDFCRDRMGGPTWNDLAGRHASWVVSIARTVASGYLGSDTHWDLAMAERDNIRAALHECERVGDVSTALRICGDLSWTWFRLGQVADGNCWLDTMLAAVDSSAARVETDQSALAQALLGRAIGAYLAGDLPTAHTRIVESVDAAARAGHTVLHSQSEAYLAYFTGAFGDPAGADDLLDRAEGRDVPEWLLAEVDMVRGQVRRAQGRVDDAIQLLIRARTRAEHWQHTYVWGSAGWILAKTLLDAGRPHDAGDVLAGVVRRLAQQGDRSSTVTGLHTMGAVASRLGRPYEGAVLLGAVDRLGARMGFHPATMDPVDGPRHRDLVSGVLPAAVFQRALKEGGTLGWREAATLAIRIGATPSRTAARPSHDSLSVG